MFFLMKGLGPKRDPHSFPTRRSSDLEQRHGVGKPCFQTARRHFPPFDFPIPGFYSAAKDVEKVSVTDRKSTRLNSSHRCISYAVFCLKKKKIMCRAKHADLPGTLQAG